ncbi:MAG: 50S ribosomal protein L3 [Candidatus Sumerlaeia bacterium]|nr:50S ribosomal protein L3 [Candidatus Sumerlaeia bacterium]
MTNGLLGKKLGMTQVFDPKGRLVPVTLIQAGPCYVLQVKTVATDGYNAIRLGFDTKREKSTNKPDQGLIDKVNEAVKAQEGADSGGEDAAGRKGRREKTPVLPPLRYIREIRVNDPSNYHVGQRISADIFQIGEKVDVIGTSKGRGFQGPYKRHHSKPGPETHGSMYHRRPGSMGGSSWPSRVFPGKPLAGHMGNHRSTTLNLQVVQTDPENNLIAVKGSVPGHVNAFVIIRKNIRSRKG